MNERLLHYIWQHCHFNTLNLKTTSNVPLSIRHVGQPNSNAGADFKFASIKLDKVEWHGDVEIHIVSSDWYKHKHHLDKNYQSVILHVVWQHDTEILNYKQDEIPCLELRPIVDKTLLNKYQILMSQRSWILCQHQIKRIDPFYISHFLERLTIERLEEKTVKFVKQFEQVENDWENTFYHALCYSLGLKLNSESFLKLSKRISISTINKHKDNLSQIEAMLFGTAGFLHNVYDQYGFLLRKEFLFLKHKYSLEEMDESEWYFMRLRPPSFPTIRLALLAQLLKSQSTLFSRVIACNIYDELKNIFQVSVSDYWLTHYHFKKSSPRRKKSLGNQWINSMIINIICPLLFVYSKRKGQPTYQERAIRFLEEISAEKNTITKKFDEIGVKANNAMQSQGLIQLKTTYCDAKKCLNCNIGSKLLS